MCVISSQKMIQLLNIVADGSGRDIQVLGNLLSCNIGILILKYVQNLSLTEGESQSINAGELLSFYDLSICFSL